jgi:hypothetical protein
MSTLVKETKIRALRTSVNDSLSNVWALALVATPRLRDGRRHASIFHRHVEFAWPNSDQDQVPRRSFISPRAGALRSRLLVHSEGNKTRFCCKLRRDRSCTAFTVGRRIARIICIVVDRFRPTMQCIGPAGCSRLLLCAKVAPTHRAADCRRWVLNHA